MSATTSHATASNQDTIEPDVVTPVLVDEMAHLGFIDASTELRLKGTPQAGDASLFDEIHRLPADDKPTALCLSGGGIRSATFSLGVLQAFAASGRLERFHYLSTVSGGGYIGSWLSNWLKEAQWDWRKVIPQLAEAPRSTPTASAIHRTAATPLTRLRAYSNYLSPVVGLSMDSLSLVSIFIRNLLLNLLVWVPLIAVLMMLPRLYVAALPKKDESAAAMAAATDALWSRPDLATLSLYLAACLLVTGIAYIVADLPGSRAPQPEDKNTGQNRPSEPEPLPQGKQSLFMVACFLPVATAAVLLSLAYGHLVLREQDRPSAWHFMAAGAGLHLLGVAIGTVWRVYRKLPGRVTVSTVIALTIVALGGAGGGLMLWSSHQIAGDPKQFTDATRLLYALLAVPFLMGCFWVTMALYAGIVSRWTSEDDREWWAKATAWWLYASLGWLILFALVLYAPAMVLDKLLLNLPAAPQLGLIGTTLGLVTSAIGYWGKNSGDLKRKAKGLIDAAGGKILDLLAAAVLLVALIGVSLAISHGFQRHIAEEGGAPKATDKTVVAAQHAAHGSEPATAASQAASSARSLMTAEEYNSTLIRTPWGAILASLAACLALAWAVSALIGANIFSLHGMYGNRLVRAYLGAGRERRNPHWFTGFDPKDNPPLSSLRQSGKLPKDIRLFPVINIALNLVKPSTRRLSWQQRKACSFTATPLHCGADGVGFVQTAQYGSEKGMTLGRALTISGAAASPNMGYHSSALVTLVMTLFNVRLGWWLPNPGIAGKKQWHRDGPSIGFWAMLNEALGRTTDDRPTVYLSDGGHFDNLGLYEMVRRRCHRIVVVDCTADPTFKYADLLSTIRKIRIDFGIPIDLPAELPGPGRKTSHARMITGTIRYSARDGCDKSHDGTLYVLKPRMVGNEPPEIQQYAQSGKKSKAPFPHQSTIDQFFDEDQFESYRTLGRLTAARSFPSDDEWPKAPLINHSEADEAYIGKTEEKAMQDKEESKSGWASGLASQVADLGQGAALATALTIGGTLGVAGTVALKNAEVSLADGTQLQLADSDRTLIQEGIRLRADPPPVTPSSPQTAQDISRSLHDLAVAIHKLDQSISRLLNTGPGKTEDQELIDLRQQIVTLSRQWTDITQVHSTDRQAWLGWAREMETHLRRLTLLVEKGGTPTSDTEAKAQAVLESLGRIEDQLKGLKNSVDKAAPNRFLRGQEGNTP